MSKKDPDDAGAWLKRLEGRPAMVFRDELRDARYAALANAENAVPIFVALDRLGKFLNPAGSGLGHHKNVLATLAQQSPLAIGLDPKYHTRLERLFDEVRMARNDAMHQGIYARHLTRHAVHLADVLEDALMMVGHENSLDVQVSDVMVRNATVAELWHPLSFVRQRMVDNSFTFLPVQNADGDWMLLSDESLAKALRMDGNDSISSKGRNERLILTVEEAIARSLLILEEAGSYARCDTLVKKVLLEKLGARMVLVIDQERRYSVHKSLRAGDLVGVLMPFDLL